MKTRHFLLSVKSYFAVFYYRDKLQNTICEICITVDDTRTQNDIERSMWRC